MIPNYTDKYSDYVKRLELGHDTIDYQDFRFSFIDSEQFKIAKKRASELDSLTKEMYAQMKKSSHQDIINITKKMLSIDYTSMIAHKILRQTYKMVDDTSNARKYKTIKFGLLNSIVKKTDGQSCATAWKVIQVEEEYFILGVIEAELLEQSLVNKGGLCDKMLVKEGDEERTYYFETSKSLKGIRRWV